LLPFLPALAASSPVAESHLTGFLDYRMEVYRHNSRKIPSITGRVIPEPIYTEAEYQTEIFERNYRDIAPYDTTGTLQQPFLNSRGAIARFERGAIEIRVLDVQENPGVDLAICEFISLVLQLLIQEEFSSLDELKSLPVDPLADLLVEIIRKGERTLVDAPDVLAAFGLSTSPLTVKELWQMILERVESVFDETHFSPAARAIIRKLLAQGPLARRIVNRLEGDSGRLPEIYDELCDCLHTGQMFGD
jgi:gamma-glutamyl:cysteine ligase YbdK (ATP-grasp superfamily)